MRPVIMTGVTLGYAMYGLRVFIWYLPGIFVFSARYAVTVNFTRTAVFLGADNFSTFLLIYNDLSLFLRNLEILSGISLKFCVSGPR